MASVHLLSAAPDDPRRYPKGHLDRDQLVASAQVDRFHVHHLAEDPAEADLILFAETAGGAGHYFHRVRRHPLYREFRHKCYLWASADTVVPFLPGVYTSIERRWYWPSWTRSGHYLGVREDAKRRYEAGRRPSTLYSFVGAADTHPVRERIMRLTADDAILVDSSAEARAVAREERAPLPQEEFLARYVASIAECAFVLCPRGGGASSFRLFETMMLGRVPVIISDQWVPPEGPPWAEFSLRVAERDVESIPALLRERASEAAVMGETARHVWVEWFSEEASFHRTVEWCLDLARHARSRAGLRRYAPYVQLLRPYHAARSVLKGVGHGRPSVSMESAESAP